MPAVAADDMKAKSIQIRNVPAALHRRLKARAAAEGMSMSAYIRRELERASSRPSPEEFLRELRDEPVLALEPSPTEVLRQERKALGMD